jgi:pimeloyl-ACP methyl ester carboxylesterase
MTHDDPPIRTLRLQNGIRLPCAEHGPPDGTPVLLLHGYAGSWRSFASVLPHLPRTIRALVPTQRGHGDASKPDDCAIGAFAADAAATLDALGVACAVIVGHSMGAAVAQRLAIDHPDRVLGLVLAGAFPTGRGNRALGALWTDTVARLTDPIDEAFVWAFLSGTSARPVPLALLEVLAAETRKMPARVWQAVLRALLSEDHSAELARIAAPTLLIWGARDTLASRDDQDRLLRAIRNARLTIYPESGHAPHREEPERFAHDIATFVAGPVGTLAITPERAAPSPP